MLSLFLSFAFWYAILCMILYFRCNNLFLYKALKIIAFYSCLPYLLSRLRKTNCNLSICNTIKSLLHYIVNLSMLLRGLFQWPRPLLISRKCIVTHWMETNKSFLLMCNLYVSFSSKHQFCSRFSRNRNSLYKKNS